MKKTVGIIMLAIAGLLMLNVGIISADEHPTATVSGTVTDGTDNAPIMDAVVMLEGSDPVLQATTDVDGNYELTDVPVDGPSFTASVEGYDSEMVTLVLIEDGAATVNFSLQPSAEPVDEQDTATVSGTVTDGTDDAPIMGAVVMLDGSDPVLSATTDVNGNYELTDVPVDEPSFTASVEGYDSETVGPVLIEDGAATVNFSLLPSAEPADEPETATVSGTVTDGTDNTPIMDAVVMLEGSNPVLQATTDENGNYVLTDVPVDEPNFTASVEGYDSETVGLVLIEDGAATVNFSLQPVTLQPVDGEEGVEDEEEGGKVAGTRKGYVGIYVGAAAVVTGAATSSATLTTPTTGAATAGYFMVDTKQGMIKIHTPNEGSESVTDGIESFAQKTGSKWQTPTDGDRVVVLVEFVDQGDGELVKVALWVKVKPTKPLLHTVGAVVGIATDENGVRTVSIMRKNGKVKDLQLGPDAEVPEVGDLVTAFQSRGHGANGPPVARGLVRAEAVRQRLEGFLEDLTGGDAGLPPQALEHRSQRVAAIAALLKNHAANHVEIIQHLSKNDNLPPQAVAGMQKGLGRAELGFARAKAKGDEAKTKARSRPAGGGQSQGGRGDQSQDGRGDQSQGGRGNQR